MNENLVKEIVSLIIERQGRNTPKHEIVDIVGRVIDDLEKRKKPSAATHPSGHFSPSESAVLPSSRFIVSVFGANRPGIVHGITAVLAEMNCDILDISQKFVENLFYMILVVDAATSPHDFVEIKERLTGRGEELSAKVYVQNEDVFRYVNRL